MDHEDEARASRLCLDAEGGYVGLQIPRDALGVPLATGQVVHAIIVHDPTLAEFLPRPLETTSTPEFNLYLARPGEDVATLQRAFDPGSSAEDVLPVLVTLLAAGTGLHRRKGNGGNG